MYKNILVNLVINLQESALVSGIVINSIIRSFIHSFIHYHSFIIIHLFIQFHLISFHSFIHSSMEGPVKSIHSVRHEGKFFPHFHQSHSTQMVCRFPSCNCFGANFNFQNLKASATSAHSLYCIFFTHS